VRLVAGFRAGRIHLIIGCDGNAHNTSWGSSDSNERDESLFNYIMTNGFDIINRGNRPTFITSNRQDVVDITIATFYAGNFVKNWYLSEEVSCSDRRYIRCTVYRTAECLLTVEAQTQTNRRVEHFLNKVSQSAFKYQIQNLHKKPRQQLLLLHPIIRCAISSMEAVRPLLLSAVATLI
jgi:hypothetical protein